MKILLKDILAHLQGAQLFGNANALVTSVCSFHENLSEGELSWCNTENASKLALVKSGVVICGIGMAGNKVHEKVHCIEVAQPRAAFRDVLKKFFATAPHTHSISSTASIASSVKLGNRVFIGNHVTIEENCTIEDGSYIGHGTVLYANTEIGKNVRIGSNCTIGGVGFGYEKNEKGEWEVMPHVGNVVIKDHVEIGNNTAIDRAVMGSTLIEENVKVDNLVHIAHGVKIGRNSLIIANAMIGGSTEIGENVWLAPSASLLNKIKVDKDAYIGMGAVVLKNVGANETVVGNPAKPLPKKEKN